MKMNHSWIADTLALVTFTVVTGMFIEIVIVGMTLHQSVISRLMCQPLNISLGRVYGLYRDRIISRVCGERKTILKETVGDILAYLSFQLPLYIGILIAVGMDMQGIIKAAISQTVALVILGAPYGHWLGFVRSMVLKKSLVSA